IPVWQSIRSPIFPISTLAAIPAIVALGEVQ
ncbi:unnamed protein product, partial [marine sediment metagenome]